MVQTVNRKGSKCHEQSYCCSTRPSKNSWSSSKGATTESISGQTNPVSQMRLSKCTKEK